VVLRRFFLSSRNIERGSQLWNAGASLVSAGQSGILLILVAIFLGDLLAGVYAIALAQAYLFYAFGSYGMRRYLASDVKHRFTMGEYVSSRVVTASTMLIAGVGTAAALWWTGVYDATKALACALVTGSQVVDVVDELIGGILQRANRLDIGAKIFFMRILVSTLAAVIVLVTGGGLLWSLGALLGASLACQIIFTWLVSPQLASGESTRRRPGVTYNLLKACFPLFLTALLAQYVGNSPKYGIELVLDDLAQARFNYLAMPTFVIQLFALWIFTPLIYRMSLAWAEADLPRLRRLVWRVIGAISVITVVAVIGGALIGLPILSFIYQTDLRGYLGEFIILLVAGGLVAIVGFLSALIIVMRHSTTLLLSYLLAGLLAITAPIWVRQGGLMGACQLYGLLHGLQCLVLIGIIAWSFRRQAHGL
jgi:O-antigen/teichoic acid export membrane protein